MQKIGRSEDFYLPAEFEVSDLLEENNTLYLHFISPISYMGEQEWKEKWNGSVLRCKTVRKPIHDFPPEKMEKGSSYQGAVPYFTPVAYMHRYLLYIMRKKRSRRISYRPEWRRMGVVCSP